MADRPPPAGWYLDSGQHRNAYFDGPQSTERIYAISVTTVTKPGTSANG